MVKPGKTNGAPRATPPFHTLGHPSIAAAGAPRNRVRWGGATQPLTPTTFQHSDASRTATRSNDQDHSAPPVASATVSLDNLVNRLPLHGFQRGFPYLLFAVPIHARLTAVSLLPRGGPGPQPPRNRESTQETLIVPGTRQPMQSDSRSSKTALAHRSDPGRFPGPQEGGVTLARTGTYPRTRGLLPAGGPHGPQGRMNA